MSTYFLNHSEQIALERLMRVIPHAVPRGGGKKAAGCHAAYIECLCKLCAHSASPRNCGHTSAYGRNQRTPPLRTLARLLAAEAAIPALTERVGETFTRNDPIYSSEEHRKRTLQTAVRSGSNPAILSAAYLLASDGSLWDWTTNPALSKQIGHRKIVRDPKRQTLLNAASGLYRGTLPVSPDSLCDKRHTEDTLFRLIFIAFIVRRYGAAVIFTESGEIA